MAVPLWIMFGPGTSSKRGCGTAYAWAAHSGGVVSKAAAIIAIACAAVIFEAFIFGAINQFFDSNLDW